MRGAVSFRCGPCERYGLEAKAAFHYGEKLRKVRAEDLARACRKYLDPESGVVAVVRP